MNKKSVIGIILIISLMIIMIFGFNKNKKTNSIPNNITIKEDNEVLYDEETGLYYLKNSETDEIIYASKNKEELQIYIDNPDYNPNPLAPKRTSLEDYLYIEEYESIVEE